jgi:2-dehydro-3-deoxyglucarate aldolase/4-hydroxy-2-oxoheptanedioate aldolase
MHKNLTKQLLREGKVVTGPIIEEAQSVGTIKAVAHAGHDYVWLDTEHSATSWKTIEIMAQYALAIGITPLVRVTDLDYALIARALDTGAHGVIVPRVESAAAVEEVISYAKYPPVGRRGAGGWARNSYTPIPVGPYLEEANNETMVVIQVEHPRAVEALSDFVKVPGVDVLCVGPQDLSINLGVPGQFDSPIFQETMKEIVTVATGAGIPVGMVSKDAASFKHWVEMGYRFLAVNSDGGYITQGATRDRQILKEFIGR